jgi:hypothetical protein
MGFRVKEHFVIFVPIFMIILDQLIVFVQVIYFIFLFYSLYNILRTFELKTRKVP